MSERIHFTVGGREHYHPLVDDVASLVLRAEAAQHRLAAVEAERDEARAFGEQVAKAHNALMEGRTVSCIYCGFEFPGGTPSSDHDALREHALVCPVDHPLRAALAEVERLREALDYCAKALRKAGCHQAADVARAALAPQPEAWTYGAPHHAPDATISVSVSLGDPDAQPEVKGEQP